ncbi:MAG: DNA replication/repair protein RecF [Pseudomonadota bacterium]
MIKTLRIDGVRNIAQCEIEPGDGLNFFQGANAAGKTSVLEAIHCLALGRSFRPGGRNAWIARDQDAAQIFAALADHRLGLEQRRGEWTGRIDSETVRQRSRFSALLPLLTFHPDAHSLIEGEPVHRRRLVDQGVFHVEHAYLGEWRAFRRALDQRNAALRTGAGDRELAGWERPIVEAGEPLTARREGYIAQLQTALEDILTELDARVPPISLTLKPGWPQGETLEAALARSRSSDRERGFTQVGPQRSDLRIRDELGAVAGRLSRGQQKILTVCLLVAQGRVFEKTRSSAPIFLFDDVGSELDVDHESRVGAWLANADWQVWMTGLHAPAWLSSEASCRMFHVEQGAVSAVL